MKKEQIKRLLPSVFQRTAVAASPMLATLGVMEGMQAPSEAALDNLAATFDPYRTPDDFVAYLATWVDLEGLLDVPRGITSSASASLSTGVGRLRELTAAAMTLSQWRGTRKGLQLFLETATGMKGFEIDENVIGDDGKTRPFHIRITAPGPLVKHRRLVERIIEIEKPGYVTYDLEFK